MKKTTRERLLTRSGAKACVAMAGFAGLVAFGIATQGCNLVTDACTETAAERASAAILVSDAQARVDEAKDVVARISNQDVRGAAIDALSGAQAGLDAARATLAGVTHMCEAKDVKAAFADFVLAWSKLAPFLSLLGGPSAGSQVQTPLVVSM